MADTSIHRRIWSVPMSGSFSGSSSAPRLVLPGCSRTTCSSTTGTRATRCTWRWARRLRGGRRAMITPILPWLWAGGSHGNSSPPCGGDRSCCGCGTATPGAAPPAEPNQPAEAPADADERMDRGLELLNAKNLSKARLCFTTCMRRCQKPICDGTPPRFAWPARSPSWGWSRPASNTTWRS